MAKKSRQEILEEDIECCENPQLSDLSNGTGEYPNYQCKNCGSHFYKSKLYTLLEWNNF